MKCTALRASPFTDGQILCLWIAVSAMGTGLAGRIERVHLAYVRSVQDGLVRELPEEFRPACIRDGLGKSMVSHHVPDSQMFDGNGLILPDQCRGRLVQKISSDIRNPFMHTGDTDAGFGSVR